MKTTSLRMVFLALVFALLAALVAPAVFADGETLTISYVNSSVTKEGLTVDFKIDNRTGGKLAFGHAGGCSMIATDAAGKIYQEDFWSSSMPKVQEGEGVYTHTIEGMKVQPASLKITGLAPLGADGFPDGRTIPDAEFYVAGSRTSITVAVEGMTREEERQQSLQNAQDEMNKMQKEGKEMVSRGFSAMKNIFIIAACVMGVLLIGGITAFVLIRKKQKHAMGQFAQGNFGGFAAPGADTFSAGQQGFAPPVANNGFAAPGSAPAQPQAPTQPVSPAAHNQAQYDAFVNQANNQTK